MPTGDNLFENGDTTLATAHNHSHATAAGGNERALFTNDFAHSMFDTDFILYIRLGTSYKF